MPAFYTVLVEVYVRHHPWGGSDKSSNGHRYDSIPIANGIIGAGMSCQLVHYVHEQHDKFFEVCARFDAIIVRCSPGQIAEDGGNQDMFNEGLQTMRRQGIQVWPSPNAVEFMEAKDALCKVATLNIGLKGALTYHTPEDFASAFARTIAFHPRTIKPSSASSGENVWIVKLKEGNYCKTFGERSCANDEALMLVEASDNHMEEHTLSEFVEFCLQGRTSKSGTWMSKSDGKYFDMKGGQLVDQGFCPKLEEGELQYNMVGKVLVSILHKAPLESGVVMGGIGANYKLYDPEEPKFRQLTEMFLQHDLENVMPCLGLTDEDMPLWWTADFVLTSLDGEAEQDKWVLQEFNCSCVGIKQCLAACCTNEAPFAKYTDITRDNLAEAQNIGAIIGNEAGSGSNSKHLISILPDFARSGAIWMTWRSLGAGMFCLQPGPKTLITRSSKMV